jgi:quercetin dioxygenase-like cupin family protein
MSQIKDIIPKELMEGITGYYAHGKNMSFGLVEITAGTIMPVHQHVHEQITYVLEGQLEMEIDNVIYLLTAGSYHIIPSNVLHGANAITACKLIDVFAPVREEYKTTQSKL